MAIQHPQLRPAVRRRPWLPIPEALASNWCLFYEYESSDDLNWYEIPTRGAEGYLICDLGDLMDRDTGEIVRSMVHPDGKRSVELPTGYFPECEAYEVDDLLCFACYGRPRPDGYACLHTDGDYMNLDPRTLGWDRKEIVEAERERFMQSGGAGRALREFVVEWFNEEMDGHTSQDLAFRLGLPRKEIWKLARGQSRMLPKWVLAQIRDFSPAEEDNSHDGIHPSWFE